MNIYLVIPYADTPDDRGYCGAVRAIRARSEQDAFDIMANDGERGGCNHGIHELVELPTVSPAPPARLTDHERELVERLANLRLAAYVKRAYHAGVEDSADVFGSNTSPAEAAERYWDKVKARDLKAGG